jgi:multidrug efflux pump subunit AcrB
MRISDFAVRNFPFMLVVFVLLVALGVSSWKDIPRTEDPSVPITAFNIIAIYPGADPIEVERQVVEPIEDVLHTLDDVKEMNTTSADSLGIVRIEFNADIDVDRTFDEINREIAALSGSLPAGLSSLKVDKINPSLVNILQVALVSETAAWQTLEDAAELVKDRLERVPGVRDVDTWAYPDRELRVELDLKRLAERNLRATQVLEAVASRNTNVPGGSVDLGPRRFNIKTSGNYSDPEEVRETVILSDGERLVRVRDIADVRWDFGPEDYTARLNGERAVFVTANQRENQNIFRTREGMWAALDALEAELPAGVRMVRSFDQSQNVADRLNRLSLDFIIAISLVLITLLPLGLRASGIVMVSIPLSLAIGLSALYFAGFSLNQMSIAGFIVALGLLVDDSIVVTENIARYLRMGHERMEAAMLATRQISLAVVGCTATLLFAFLPLLALPGNAGKFIQSLPLAVVFTVIASLFVALTIIPFLASRVLARETKEEGNIVLQALMRFIHGVYGPLLAKALRRPWLTLSLAGAVVAASFTLIPVIGFSLFPKANTPQFLVQITLSNGSSIQQTDRVLRQVEEALLEEPEVVHVMSNLGRGNPQIYYNVFAAERAANYAEAFVQLERYDGRATQALFERLRSRYADIPGADIVVKEFENGPPTPAPIAIRVVGDDLGQLRTLAAEVEEIMRTTAGTRNVINPQRRSRIDLALNVDTTRAGLLGVAPLEIDQTVRLALSGIQAGDFREADGDTYPVMLRAPLRGQATLEALEGLHVGNTLGAQVPLTQLARLELTESPTSIQRNDRTRAVLLTAYTETGYNTERVTSEVVRQVDRIDWPAGYGYQISGEVESREESFEGFGAAILVAIFGILAVLVLEFGSFRSTLIVAGVIPLGIMGGLLMLFFTGNSLSFTAVIGFIALVGIEIKNSILLVDFTNQLRAQGKPLDEAIIEAGEIRFLPILLTTVTAIGALTPLALSGAGLYAPMASVIIGGLITSTLIGRLVTPVMYKLLPPAQPELAPGVTSATGHV